MLWFAIGLQKTIGIITRYPGILIVSIFSCWTVGPVKTSNSRFQDMFARTESIGISPTHTWVNLAITVAFSISYGLFYYPNSRVHLDGAQWIISLGLIIPTVIYILIPTFLCVLHGQYLINYQAFLCFPNRCRSCCCKDFHNTEYTILNTSTMEEDIAKQEFINQPINFEEVGTGTGCLTKLSCCYLCFFIVLLLLGLLACICFVIFIYRFNLMQIFLYSLFAL